MPLFVTVIDFGQKEGQALVTYKNNNLKTKQVFGIIT